jgi:hypothetical protein
MTTSNAIRNLDALHSSLIETACEYTDRAFEMGGFKASLAETAISECNQWASRAYLDAARRVELILKNMQKEMEAEVTYHPL